MVDKILEREMRYIRTGELISWGPLLWPECNEAAPPGSQSTGWASAGCVGAC